MNPLLILFIVGVVLMVVGITFYIGSKCPHCGRRWGLQNTGEHRSGGKWRPDEIEYRCRHCGHMNWRADMSD